MTSQTLQPARRASPCAQVISTLRGHDDKVRVVLNKADQVDQQQLMRVYGALMWSLSKVFRSPEASHAAAALGRSIFGLWRLMAVSGSGVISPEFVLARWRPAMLPASHALPTVGEECDLQVCKVYIGSFNASNPIRDDVNPHGKELFEKEQANLLQDLFEIPQRSTDRKVSTPHSQAQMGHSFQAGRLPAERPYVVHCYVQPWSWVQHHWTGVSCYHASNGRALAGLPYGCHSPSFPKQLPA